MELFFSCACFDLLQNTQFDTHSVPKCERLCDRRLRKTRQKESAILQNKLKKNQKKMKTPTKKRTFKISRSVEGVKVESAEGFSRIFCHTRKRCVALWNVVHKNT